jgi:hypothetical protein
MVLYEWRYDLRRTRVIRDTLIIRARSDEGRMANLVLNASQSEQICSLHSIIFATSSCLNYTKGRRLLIAVFSSPCPF